MKVTVILKILPQYFQIQFYDWYQEYLSRKCMEMYPWGWYWRQFNFSSGNILVLSGIRPSVEPTLTKIFNAIYTALLGPNELKSRFLRDIHQLTLLKMFFIAMRKPCLWFSPNLLYSLLPQANTLPTSVRSIVPSWPQRTSRTKTESVMVTSMGRHL